MLRFIVNMLKRQRCPGPAKFVEPPEHSPVPKNLEECLRYLETHISDSEKPAYADPNNNHHFFAGRWIRNEWRLWHKDSPLTQYFNARGIYHADDMSGIILRSFQRHLNREPIQLAAQIQECQASWQDAYVS